MNVILFPRNVILKFLWVCVRQENIILGFIKYKILVKYFNYLGEYILKYSIIIQYLEYNKHRVFVNKLIIIF